MFIFLVIFCLVLLVLFPNVMFYTLSLMVISVLVLFWLVSSNVISVLFFMLVVIVYIGAMMILIGYICAVSPNFNISQSISSFYLTFITFFLLLLVLFSDTFFLDSISNNENSEKQPILLDLFLSDWGLNVFLLVVFMLFLVLLIVTSQWVSPQGPFRSI